MMKKMLLGVLLCALTIPVFGAKAACYRDEEGTLYKVKIKRTNPLESQISLNKPYFIRGTAKKESLQGKEGVMLSYRSSAEKKELFFFIPGPDGEVILQAQNRAVPIVCLKKYQKKQNKTLFLCKMLREEKDGKSAPEKTK